MKTHELMQTGTVRKNGNLSTEEFKRRVVYSNPPQNQKKACPKFQTKKMLPYRAYGCTGHQIKFDIVVLTGVMFH